MRITPAGNVGIGTTTPTSPLTVYGDMRISATGGVLWFKPTSGQSAIYTSGTDLRFANGAGTEDRITIQTGGNVGIGTTNPGHKLHVVSATSEDGIIVDTPTYPELRFDRNSVAKAYIGVAGTAGGYFTGSSADSLIIRSDVGPIHLGYQGAAPYMTVGTDGKVGIGTTTPLGKLTIASGGGGLTGLAIDNNSASSYAPIDFTQGSSITSQIFSTGASFSSGAFGGNELNIAQEQASGVLHLAAIGASGIIKFTTGGNSTANERVRITSAGNVGIGTTNPSEKLHVAGTILGGTSATNGELVLAGAYGGANDYLLNLGSLRSSGGTMLGYGVKPSTSVASGYSSATSINIARSAIALDHTGIHLTTAATQTVAQDSALAMSERLTILNNGNVGVGTANPSSGHLEVQGTNVGQQIYAVSSATTGANYGGDFEAQGSGATSNTGVYAVATGATNNYSIFVPNGFPAAGANNYQLYLASDAKSYFGGSVGIGRTDPLAKLEVDDTAGPATGSAPQGGLVVSNRANTAGLLDIGVDTTGTFYSWLQSRGSSSASYYNLVLNPAGGNVGIGTTGPDAKLDVAGAIANTNGVYNHYRNVAQIDLGGGAQTGTLKIVLPQYRSSTMLSFTIKGYDYSGIGAWEVRVSGYNYNGSTDWINTSATISGRAPFTKVRLASNGSQDLILLGDTSTTWSYGHVEIADVSTGFGTLTGWGSGYTMALITSESGIVSVSTPSIDTYTTSTGNFGIGTTSPANVDGWSKVLDVHGTTDAKSIVTTNSIETGMYSHNSGFFSAPAGGMIGTRSNHALSFITNATSRVTIDAFGNVGVGTPSPQKTLDVVAPNNDFVTVGARTLGVGAWTGISFGYREENNAYRKAAIVFERKDEVGGAADGTIHILNDGTNDSSNATLADARLSIRSNGNVGIGTTTPSGKLHIAGEVSAVPTTNVYQQLEISGSTNPTHRLSLGVVTSGGAAGTGLIQALTNGVQFTNLSLNPTGGNVGIGTTAPVSKFNVVTGSNVSTVISDVDGQGTSNCSTYNTCLQITGANHSLLQLTGRAYSTLNMYFDGTQAVKSGLFTSGAYSLGFGVNGNTSDILIDTGHNVGIGTTTISAKLTVAGNTILSPFQPGVAPNAPYPFNNFRGWESDNTGYYDGIGYQKTDGTNKKLFVWWTDNQTETNINSILNVATPGHTFDGTAPNSGRIIGASISSSGTSYLNGGNVGVGTTMPAYKLDVNGEVFNTSGSSGALGLSSCLTGYGCNTYPTLKSTASYIYFDVASTYAAYMDTGGVLHTVSDRNKKENFVEADPQVILGKIDELPMYQWNFIGQDTSVKHIAPIAQDFYELFHLGGNDEKTITSIDPAGIALVGVKALSARLSSTTISIVSLESRVAALESGAIVTATSTLGVSEITSALAGGLVAWFADAGNGIGDFFANVLHAKEKICVDDQCLTKEDVHALLVFVQTNATTTDHGVASSTPPVVETPSVPIVIATTTPPIDETATTTPSVSTPPETPVVDSGTDSPITITDVPPSPPIE